MSCLRRMILQPYNIACLLFGWVLCNLGMVSPLLPLAVTAQIIMGTLYVYTIKMTTDLNLFYSMGDTALFVKLQGFCSSAFIVLVWLLNDEDYEPLLLAWFGMPKAC